VLSVGGLFDGAGLLAYGLHLAGLEHAWLCESDPWRREVLALRFPGIPVHADARAVGARTARRVDVIAGGFPCKGASTSGLRNGFDHAETVLWREMARAIGELRPRYVLVENVANILALDDGAVWGEVLTTLAALGYDTVWDCMPAAAVGAPHLRDRVFAVATHTPSISAGEPPDGTDAIAGSRDTWRVARSRGRGAAADANGHGVREQSEPERGSCDPTEPPGAGQAPADSGEGRRERVAAEHGGQSPEPGSYAQRPGIPVEWGPYECAIRRWEAVSGRSAPEPLVRRVDDRSAARVERSRLSALGDGVQVQIGELVGRHIIELERQRLGVAA